LGRLTASPLAEWIIRADSTDLLVMYWICVPKLLVTRKKEAGGGRPDPPLEEKELHKSRNLNWGWISNEIGSGERY